MSNVLMILHGPCSIPHSVPGRQKFFMYHSPTMPMNDVKTKYISYLYVFEHEMFTPGTNGQFYRLLNMLNKPVSFSECG